MAQEAAWIEEPRLLCARPVVTSLPPLARLALQTRARAEVSFNIDGQHMYEFDRTLYNWAVTYPAETGG